jgi:hypothetical protein
MFVRIYRYVLYRRILRLPQYPIKESQKYFYYHPLNKQHMSHKNNRWNLYNDGASLLPSRDRINNWPLAILPLS